MANGMYIIGLTEIMDGSIDLLTDTIRVQLIDNTLYAVNLASDYYFSEIPSNAKISSPGTLASKAIADASFDAADQVFANVTADDVNALIIYKWTGSSATSTLIAYIDTGIANFPTGALTSNTITIAWSAPPNGIFKFT